MTTFGERYKKLNDQQRLAVDTIDGPVMVVAGPGTGKTELLSVRAANILHKTDTLPGNILCLTFTDSGAVAMRERLAGLLGPDAYKVAIHTFHSFGSEVINQNGEYFYSGAHFRPSDELSNYEILSDIMEKLAHDNPLASTMNGRFTYVGDIKTCISELKRAGLTPDELDAILTRNDAFCAWVAPYIADVFGSKISKQTIAKARVLARDIETFSDQPLELIGYAPLSEILRSSLVRAVELAEEEGSTKPLTAWKNTYLEKDAHGTMTPKDTGRSLKLRALSRIYSDYLEAMQENELYDYDDMILRVVHALETFDELRYNLQETYQYILVDEFQDTNDAQMRLVWNLTNNPVSEGRPNLMVVGDDDQAIYRFQGALLSNILDFTARYRDVAVITLKDNYRSVAEVLKLARSVIVEGTERLENTMAGVDKTLTPHREDPVSRVIYNQFETTTQAHYALAKKISEECAHSPTLSRAVIARNHRQLLALLPQLKAFNIPLRYERHDNVLDNDSVRQLELVARTVHALAQQEFDVASQLLAELLAHPAWNIPAIDVWRLSVEAHRTKKMWLEVMLEREGALHDVATWLIVASERAKTEPLEFMLDYLFGVNAAGKGDEQNDAAITSPLKEYFFSSSQLETSPFGYIAHLSALQKIRTSLREYKPGQILTLADFVEFVDLHHELELTIQGKGNIETGESAVTLLSAHKSKGLEFDVVYIVDVQENIWGNGARSRGRLISFPSNLHISPVGDNNDERLRLLYVALTRARTQLVLTCAKLGDNSKELLPVGSIKPGVLAVQEHSPLPAPELTEATQNDWRTPLLSVSHANKDTLLRPLLERYKLSATHLTNFLDVSRGGPELFLVHNLLRFPQALSPSAAFGTAVHETLTRAHQHLGAHKKRRPVEDLLHDYEEILRRFQLSELDFSKLLDRGMDVLQTFFTQRYDSFTPTQDTERNFTGEHVVVGDAVLSGALDLIDIDKDEKTIFVTDYKTGKPVNSWRGKSDYEKIKLHHYEQQLMFYKLLVENSRQFTGYSVSGARIEYVEPDARGEIVLLDYVYDAEKLAQFERLLGAVWQRIMTLDFSLPQEFDASYAGILAFEDYLLSED